MQPNFRVFIVREFNNSISLRFIFLNVREVQRLIAHVLHTGQSQRSE